MSKDQPEINDKELEQIAGGNEAVVQLAMQRAVDAASKAYMATERISNLKNKRAASIESRDSSTR